MLQVNEVNKHISRHKNKNRQMFFRIKKNIDIKGT